MLPVTIDEIVKATGGELISGNSGHKVQVISTDSRTIKGGELFIPLVGELFDGHNFIDKALASGAAGFLTHRDDPGIPAKDKCKERECIVIKVKDTLKGFQDIAFYYRSKFKIPFIAITGSVGKTSTKDMVTCVLRQKYNILSTKGNLNNEFGLPLTLLDLDNTHEGAVIEMGMSGFGEISCLTNIVRPDIAIITNIGLSHIEKLGSRQNILKAKMEILEGLHKNGLIILNGDDELLSGLRNLLPFRAIYYGMGENLDLQAFNVKSAGENGTYFNITYEHTDYIVHVPVPGIHHLYNALAAIAVGLELGIPFPVIVKGIGTFTPGKMRQNIITTDKGIKVINDTYNASPTSMAAALNVLREIGEGQRKIAVLGDMLEMGDWAPDAHREVGGQVVKSGIEYLITVGKNGRHIAQGALTAGMKRENVYSFDDNVQLGRFLQDLMTERDVVLVKGSRGMKMEQIVDTICEVKS